MKPWPSVFFSESVLDTFQSWILFGTPHGRWSRPLAAALLCNASPLGAWLLYYLAGGISALFILPFRWRLGWHAYGFLRSAILALISAAATNELLSSHCHQVSQRAAALSAIAFFGGDASWAGLPRGPAKACLIVLLGFSNSQLSKAFMP